MRISFHSDDDNQFFSLAANTVDDSSEILVNIAHVSS